MDRWAEVSYTGDLLRGRGAVDAERVDTGRYRVTFDRNIRACAYVASTRGAGMAGTAAGVTRGVLVYTNFVGGASTDRDLYLQVTC